MKLNIYLLKAFIHLSALLPVIYWFYNGAIDNLGGDPVEALIHFSGTGALNLLLLTLAVSPLARKFKLSKLMQCRRLLGLYAAFYALIHLLSFITFELLFDFSLLVSEIVERPYITIGMLAFAIITALAVTSPNVIKRKMGRRWQQLHNLSYVLIVLVMLHYTWSLKVLTLEPAIYIFLTAILLFHRIYKNKRTLSFKSGR